MKLRLSLVLFVIFSSLLSAHYQSKPNYNKCVNMYTYKKGKKIMSNCAWKEYVKWKNDKPSIKITRKSNELKYASPKGDTSDKNRMNHLGDYIFERYDFTITYMAESENRFNALNMDDVGKGYSLGIVQFNGKYAKELARAIGINPYMSRGTIKRKLATPYSKEKQKQMFKKYFVSPIFKFCKNKGIRDPGVIEILVDWRVNGMPKKYYKKVNRHTTLSQVIKMRKKYYYRLRTQKPWKYSKLIYGHWIKRVNAFKARA